MLRNLKSIRLLVPKVIVNSSNVEIYFENHKLKQILK